MRYLILIIVTLFTMVSCNQEKTQSKAEPQEYLLKDSTQKPDTNSIVFNCDIDDTLNSESELLTRVTSLLELENNYQLESSEKGTVSNSIILNGLNRLSDLSLNKSKEKFVIQNFDVLTNSIANMQFCRVKGTKDLGGQTFARAKIEELTFKSENCAIKTYQIIQEIKQTGFIWEDIDKSPSSVFRIENRIYYDSSGGWYMMGYYDEIANKMQE